MLANYPVLIRRKCLFPWHAATTFLSLFSLQVSQSKDSFLQPASFETLIGKIVLLGFSFCSTTWRHSSDLSCGMGLERVRENRVGYGRLHVCKTEVEVLTLFFLGRVDQKIIRHLRSCLLITLVRSDGNIDKLIHYCLMN